MSLTIGDLVDELGAYTIPGRLRVTIGWSEEGWGGDYVAEDAADAPLLRFDITDLRTERHGEHDVHSYCTQIDGRKVTVEGCQAWCEGIARQFEGLTSLKRPAQELSWVDAGGVMSAQDRVCT